MKQTWKKMSSLFLVVCMLLTMLPTSVFAANIGMGQIYFGKNSSGFPILWYLVATDANSVTLWTPASMGSQSYDSDGHDNWSGSDICTWLNGAFFNYAFTPAEQAAITNYGSTEAPNDMNISQKIVLPSVNEMGTGSSAGMWKIDQNSRASADNWWLRTPGTSDNVAAYVKSDGEVLVAGDNVSNTHAICPALKLDVSSILFGTAAADGKSRSIGSIAKVSAPSGAMKATIVDSSIATPSLTLAAESNGTNAIKFAYSSAKTGANQYLSCALLRSNTLEYYGKLANCASTSSGEFTFPTSGVGKGTYEMEIFCEQVNADSFSDFASAPVGTMILKVDADGKGTVSGTGFSSDDSASPVLSAGIANRTSDTEGTIGFTTNEDGTAFYTVVEKDASAPDKNTVAAGTSIGSVSGTVINKSVTLTSGAKDIYVVVKDAAGNISDPLNIEAAAYVPPDIIAPVLSAGSANRTSDTEGTIGFTTDEDGTAFYTVVEKDASAPDKNTVAAGTSIGSVSGTVINQSVTLTAGSKDIYVVVKDAEGNISDPLNIEVAAYVPPDSTAPELSAGSVNRTSDTEGTIGFTTNEAGTAFCAVVEKDASAPDKRTVAAGTSIGSVSGTVTNLSVALTVGAKDIYVVVKDADGNISEPLKIQAATYVPPLIFVANEAQLKEALASTVSSDIRVQTSITLRDAAEVKANHTLIVTNTLKTQQNGSINVGSHTLTVKGGGTLSSETRTYNLFETKFDQDPHGTLNLENITVNLKNSDDHNAGGISNLTINMNTGAAIHVNSVRGLMPDDLTVNSSAMLNVTTSPGTSAVALGGVMHINGGTVNIISGVIEAYSNVKLKYTSGTLTGSNGGSISVSYRCKIEGMADKFKDRAVLFSNSSEVTVDVENNLPSASGLTVGEYLWDGTCFAKTSQIIWGETTANGVANTSDTTELTLSFANNPRALTADHFKVTGATKGILSGSGMIRTLAISNITVGEGEEVTVEITAPDGYSVTTPSKTVAVHKAAIVTDTTAPILSSGSVDRTSDTEATIYFTSDEAGTAYYSVVDKDASTPDKNVVAAGTLLGAVSSANIEKEVTLSAGEKDVYVVVKDAANNISDPLKIQVEAYVTPEQTVANELTTLGFSATVNGNTVLVSGSKIGVTRAMSFDIPSGVTVKWGAKLTGMVEKNPLLSVTNDGSLEIVSGAELENAADMGITLDCRGAGFLLVSDGTILFTGSKGEAISVRDDGTCVIQGGRISTGMSSNLYALRLDGALAVIANNVPINNIATDDVFGASAVVRVADGTSSATIGSAEGLSVTPYNLGAGDSLTTQWLVRSGVSGINVLKNKSKSYWFAPYSGVNLHVPSSVSSVTVAPASVSVQKGATYQFNATVDGTSNPSQVVTWTIEGGNGTTAIGTDGKLTIAASETATTLTVRATSVTDTSKFGTATVTVTTSGGNTNPGGGSSSGGNTGGGSSGGGGSTSTTKQEANVTGGDSSIKTEIKTDTKAGSASAELTSLQVAKGKDIAVTIPKITGVSNYSLGIPGLSLSSTGASGSVTLNTDVGNIMLPSNMLAGTNAVSGKQAQIHIGVVKSSDLPKDAQDKVGNHPIVSLELSIDGKTTAWNNPNAPVTVSIPYTPTAEELKNPKQITVWYIDGSGKLIEMKDAKYDSVAKKVVFTTTHFSNYAVGYQTSASSIKFSDVLSDAWYYDVVNFIAEKEITTGTGNGKFSPEATLTRGQFIVMLMKAYGIQEDKNATANFTDAGNTYYTGYLAAAKAKGISSGLGDNKFGPEQAITRQEMFTLLYNAQKVIGQIPKGNSGKTVSDFSDASQIANWARESITTFIGTGTISGNAGKIQPLSTTTRAEMAQVLYNLLKN